jgi:hypothetical protein
LGLNLLPLVVLIKFQSDGSGLLLIKGEKLSGEFQGIV